MEEIDANAQRSEKSIHKKVEELREKLNQREATLIAQVSEVKERKRKEMIFQKEQLEKLLDGIKSSSQITETMLKRGTNVEIGMSKKQVISRLDELHAFPQPLEPIHDSCIRFDFLAKFNTLIESINEFGSIISKEADISPLNSFVDLSGFDMQPTLSQPVSFKISAINSRGEKFMSNDMEVDGEETLPFSIELKTPNNTPTQVSFPFPK